MVVVAVLRDAGLIVDPGLTDRGVVAVAVLIDVGDMPVTVLLDVGNVLVAFLHDRCHVTEAFLEQVGFKVLAALKNPECVIAALDMNVGQIALSGLPDLTLMTAAIDDEMGLLADPFLADQGRDVVPGLHQVDLVIIAPLLDRDAALGKRCR